MSISPARLRIHQQWLAPLFTPALLHTCFFFDPPLAKASNDFEAKILSAISDLGIDGVKLFRTTSLAKDCFLTESKETIYRISSEKHFCCADFILERGGANILMLTVSPDNQGHGIRVRRFIKMLTEILFASGIEFICGKASPPSNKEIRRAPAWKARDWRTARHESGRTRLVEFYLNCGFESDGSPDGLVMHVQQFKKEKSLRIS